MNFEYVDSIYRSRLTLLNILEERGFDVEKYRKFSPAEISVATEAFNGLSFTVNKRDDPSYTCEVMYSRLSRQKLESFLLATETEKPRPNEYIIMILDPVSDVHHQLSLKTYLSNNKLRVSFFSVQQLIFDPREHILVPHHEIVPESEHRVLMEQWNVTSKSQLPLIRYHVDPIVRILGGVPGDIIRILRPSPSAGTYQIYRVVSP
jgi:DNA-directed RNA polymerase subunit H